MYKIVALQANDLQGYELFGNLKQYSKRKRSEVHENRKKKNYNEKV